MPRDPSSPTALADLATLPFAEQVVRLRASLDGASTPLREVLAAAASLRDHEPFALVVRTLAERDGLARADVAGEMGALLVALPDTGVQRVLRGLDGLEWPRASHAAWAEIVRDVLTRLPVERIAATCLLLRWLRRADSNAARSLASDAIAICRDAIARGSEPELEALRDEHLVHLTGEALAELARDASARGARVARALDARLERFASRVLDVLESAPKSLSQANAEDLLARRVYTEPGHFLVELLQNADDAGATRFAVEITPREVRVTHDGAPFDARDVVGVLSIGLTTKLPGQIGLFGVGFKSVYDVCDRPQVYSGAFCFEVADVSRPRRIAPRQDARRAGDTLLVLPLRAPDDPRRGARALHARALALPPETLLTLANVRTLEISTGGDLAASPERRTVSAIDAPSARIDLRCLESGAVASYLVESHRLARDAGAPEPPVRVAIALGAGGEPVALPAGAPTVYSYLPTLERSGLRFLVHAHFDVPVDRERLDWASTRNRDALERAGALLAHAVARLADEASRGLDGSEARLDAVIDVLPLRDELAPHAAYDGLFAALRDGLADVAFLLGADGVRRAPVRAACCDDPAIARVLADVPLGSVGARRTLAPASNPRADAVALALGAARFGVRELCALLATDVARAHGDRPPPWLARAVPAVLDALGRASLADAPVHLVETLALLPDASGALHAASDGVIARASPPLRAVYLSDRRLLDVAIDRTPTAGQSALLELLGVPVLGLRDLCADLLDPLQRAQLAAVTRAPALLEYLAAQPGTDIAASGLAALPMFPDEHAVLRALRASETSTSSDIAWLTRNNAPGRFIRAMQGAHPPLINASLNARFARLFDTLGASTVDWTALCALLANGELVPAAADLDVLHRAIRDDLAELPPRLRDALARAPLWPDRHGARRPLQGPGRALWPADESLCALWPDAPWLTTDLASASVLPAALGARAVGASAVARAMLGVPEDGEPSLDAGDPETLTRAYACLSACARVAPLAPPLPVRLAAASVWRDTQGALHPLATLRRTATDPALAQLYAQWSAFATIETVAPMRADGFTASAWEAAAAIGLGEKLTAATYESWLDDLLTTSDAPPDSGSLAMQNVLSRAAVEIAPTRLARISTARIFRAGSSGEAHTLASWSDTSPAANACFRGGPDATLRAALAGGDRPLMVDDDERALARVLDALGVKAPGVWDLIVQIERDESPAITPTHAATVRRAVIASRSALKGVAGAAERLSSLVIWPARDGTLRTSREVVRGAALVQALGNDWAAGSRDDATSSHDAVVLDPSAEHDADALADLCVFCAPGTYVVARVLAEARVGEPVSAQPAWLADPTRNAQLLARIATSMEPDELARVPLVVDAAGRLVAGRRFVAAPGDDASDTGALLRGLPVEDELAHPTWAAAFTAACESIEAPVLAKAASLACAALAPPIPARRVVSALADISRDEVPADRHGPLRDPARRSLLYGWIQAHADEIADDGQMRGVLARACVVLSERGVLRAPTSLLLEPDLPDLGIDWNASDEVPLALQRWMRRVFRLDGRRLEPLVEHLLDAHDRAIEAGDTNRADELLRFLARSLRDPVGDLAALPKALKIHRRLVVQSDDGTYRRPRELIAPTDPGRTEMIRAFAAEPPPVLDARYAASESVRALLAAAGTACDLDAARLRSLLDGDGVAQSPGALLALARYVAILAVETRALRSTLSLDRRAWIPDTRGERHAPGELFWPSADLDPLLGLLPSARVPHPEFVRTVPASLGQWLPFRHAHDLSAAEMAATLRDGSPAPEPVLDWFGASLAAGRIAPTDVARLFARVRCLADDEGVCRVPRELYLDDPAELLGRRAGRWGPDGTRHARLAEALGIARSPDHREIVQHLAAVARDVQSLGANSLLDAEPELVATLPCAWSAFASRRAASVSTSTEPLALIAEDLAGEPVLTTTADRLLYLPTSAELIAALRGATTSARAVLLANAPGGCDPDDALALFRARGVCDIDDAWRPRLTGVPDGDVTRDHAVAAHALLERIDAVWKVLPGLTDRVVGADPRRPWRFERHASPTEIRVLPPGAAMPGEVGPVDVSLVRACVLDVDRRRIWIVRDALDDVAIVATEVCRRAVSQDRAMLARLVPHVEALLACTDEEHMRARVASITRSAVVTQSPAPVPSHEPPAPQPRPAATTERATTTASTPAPRGLLGRLRRWLATPDSPAGDGANAPAREPSRDGEAAWFRPRDTVDGRAPDALQWLADRSSAPTYGVGFTPRALPAPHAYATALVADRFDRRTQQWTAEADMPFASRGSASMVGGEAHVTFEGRFPAGQSTLPLPSFSTIRDFSADRSDARLLTDRDGRPLLVATGDTVVRYAAALEPLPDFDDTRDAEAMLAARTSPSLLARTVPDEDLPDEAHELVDRLARGASSLLARAVEIREFVRTRYRYDPDYLEDPALTRWLATVSRGRANGRIAALHAGRDATHLGRGVCFELNVLCCELLRRARIPAAVCTGWVLTRGEVSEPDHLWAVALVPTASGPRFVPIDASTTREGRPLQVQRPLAGTWRPRPGARSAAMPRPPAWCASPPIRAAQVTASRATDPRDSGDRRSEFSRAERRAAAALERRSPRSFPRETVDGLPVDDLVRVVRHLEALTGEPVAPDAASLRARCVQLLADPDTARRLHALLGDED